MCGRGSANMRFAGFAFFILMALAQFAPAQELATPARTVIRAETQLVLVDAVVQDKKGKPVHDLNAKDFRVWEDGKEQAITSVSLETSAASPEKSLKHYLVLFFDNVSLSTSDQLATRKDAARFVGAWAGPDRYMSVVNFGPNLQIAQNFTAMPGPLRQAISMVQAGAPAPDGAMPTAANVRLDTRTPAPARGRGGPATPALSEQQTMNQSLGSPYAQQDLLAGLKTVAESLSSVRGRKALVLFTGGFPQPPSSAQMAAVISACNQANVAVYVTNQGGFRTLADETGGRVIANANDLVRELGQIAEEQEEHYVLGYTPAESPEGSCHALRVAVNRAGLDVQARKGYCSAKPVDLLAGNAAAKAIETSATRAAAVPAGNLTASMQLPYFYASANVARVNLAMEIAAAGIKFDKVKGKPHAELRVTGVASKAGGEVAGRFNDVVKLDFETSKESDAFAKQPFHYEYQFDLAPGQYNLRVTLDAGEGSFGKVEMPLSVEPWDGRRLGLSGVALSKESRSVPDLAAALDDSLLEDRRPLIAGSHQIVPSGSNRFHRADLSLAYVEIYDPLLAGPNPPTVSLQIRVIDRQTGQPKEDLGSFSLANFIRPGNPVVPVAFNLPGASLPPGSYRLEVTAAHSPGTDSVVRTADFEVEQ